MKALLIYTHTVTPRHIDYEMKVLFETNFYFIF